MNPHHPPIECSPDPWTLGPALPPGWNGDAFISDVADDYVLRAWPRENPSRLVIGRGNRYRKAVYNLLSQIDPERAERRLAIDLM